MTQPPKVRGLCVRTRLQLVTQEHIAQLDRGAEAQSRAWCDGSGTSPKVSGKRQRVSWEKGLRPTEQKVQPHAEEAMPDRPSVK